MGDLDKMAQLISDYKIALPEEGLETEIYALRRLGRLKAAGSLLESAIMNEKCEARSRNLRSTLAEVRWLDGDYEQSARAFMQLDPSELKASELEKGITAYQCTCRYGLAMEWILQLRLRPEAHKAAIVHESDIWGDLDDYQRALSVLSLLGYSPGISIGVRKARLLASINRGSEAIALLTALAQENAADADSLRIIGQAAAMIGHPLEASKILYRARKLSPRDERIYALLINAVLATDFPDEVSDPPTVIVDTVVTVDDGGQITKWTLESEPPIDPLRHELAVTDELAKALLGRCVGESFSFEIGSSTRCLTILSIESKLLSVGRESLLLSPQSFPAGGIQMVDLSKLGQEEMETEIIARQAGRNQLISRYSTGEFGLYELSNLLECGPFECFANVARMNDVKKAVRRADDESREREATAAQQKSITLDCTALWTLSALGLLDRLKLVYDSVYLALVTLASISSGLGRNADAYTYDRSTRHFVRQVQSDHSSTLGFIRQNCIITPATGLLALDPDASAKAAVDFGKVALKTIGVAIVSKSVLVSDDLEFRDFAEGHGLATTSSMGVLEVFAAQGVIDLGNYSQYNDRLSRAGYQSRE